MQNNSGTHILSVTNITAANTAFAMGESNYKNGEQFGPMAGCQLEAIYLRTGQVEVIHDEHRFRMSAPSVALVASAQKIVYRYGPAKMNNILWCQYIAGGLSASGVQRLLPYCGPLPPTAASTSLMKIGADLSSDINDEMQNFSSALGIAVLEELLARKRKQETIADIPPQVHHVRRYIEEHLNSDITMATLSEVSNLSPQHLNRLYKAAFGENPLDYLWRLRVRRGAYLLRHTGMRISQIAYNTGFKTPNHFSRLIRERYGISPRDLRSQEWRGASNQ
ncbi:AraC family transcriptional regulator [Coralliovum pocilloporae]|uniref:AraC family transcriptional regulator n=1 Tax=Coralliovum pocilloporae TaxID=3066369 RepID=UPI0033073C74